MKTAILSFCLIVAINFSAWAADPFDNQLVRQIQKRHDKGVDGDVEEVKALVTDLEKLTKEQPANYMLLAYLGSAYTLRSRDCWPGPSKFHFLKEGLKTMDDAVEKDPKNIGVRFIRAVNNLNLPAFLNRRDEGRKDFKVLLEQIKAMPKNEINLETSQAIYYFAGISYKQLDEEKKARDAWKRGEELDPNTPLGLKIKTEITKLND
jgi:tetratricopeptide (TPR) repeat protein